MTGMNMARALRKVLSAESMGVILVFAALQALIYGISSSLRNTDTKQFFWVCLLGALIAFGIYRRNSNGIRASMVMIAVGLLGVWIPAGPGAPAE